MSLCFDFTRSLLLCCAYVDNYAFDSKLNQQTNKGLKFNFFSKIKIVLCSPKKLHFMYMHVCPFAYISLNNRSTYMYPQHNLTFKIGSHSTDIFLSTSVNASPLLSGALSGFFFATV